MNKPKTPPCIGHDHETEVLEDPILAALIEDHQFLTQACLELT